MFENNETKEEPQAVKEVEPTDKTKFSSLLADGLKEFNNKNYDEALKYYTKALDYSGQELDIAYMRMYSVYNMQNNIEKARLMLDKAIAKNPSYTDYWTTKLVFLDEKTQVSFADLKKIYDEALTKVDSRTKINLVTSFARIAENNKENAVAISVWEKAKEVYPANKDIYQKEIDRLKAL
jgi:tetratricopeptide (TPR) repeat protein